MQVKVDACQFDSKQDCCFTTDTSVARRTRRENLSYQNREMLRKFILQPNAKYSLWLNFYNYESLKKSASM